MHFALDALTVLIILSTVWLSYKKGLLYTIIGLVGYILSVLAAVILSVPLGSWIYTHLLQGFLTAQVKNYLAGQTVTSLSNSLGQTIQQFAPGLNLSSLFQQGTGQLENTVAQSVVQPIGMAIGRGIAFVILFFLFVAAVHIFEGFSLGLSRIPVIGTLNRIGGAVAGIAKAFLFLFLICTMVEALLPLLTVSQFPITKDVINQTTFFKYFYQLNPFAKML